MTSKAVSEGFAEFKNTVMTELLKRMAELAEQHGITHSPNAERVLLAIAEKAYYAGNMDCMVRTLAQGVVGGESGVMDSLLKDINECREYSREQIATIQAEKAIRTAKEGA